LTCLPTGAYGRTRKTNPGYVSEAGSYCIIGDKSHYIDNPEVVQIRVKGGGEIMATLKAAPVTREFTNDKGQMHYETIHNTHGDAKASYNCRYSPPQVTQIKDNDSPPREYCASCVMHGKPEPFLTKGNARGAYVAQIGTDEDTRNQAGSPESKCWPTSIEASIASQMVDRRRQDILYNVVNQAPQEKQGDRHEVPIEDNNVQARPLREWRYSWRHLPFPAIKWMAIRGKMPSYYLDPCQVPKCSPWLCCRATRQAWRSMRAIQIAQMIFLAKAQATMGGAMNQMVPSTRALNGQMKIVPSH
jgi:hypothetical protein